MQDQTIQCPKCQSIIPITATLTDQLKQKLTKEMQERFELQKKEFVDEQKKKMWKLAQEKAKEKLELELKDNIEQMQEKNELIKKMRDEEIMLRRQYRQIQETIKEKELEIERRIDKEKAKFEEMIKKRLDQETQRKLLEKDEQLKQMRTTIEELKRKADQGSMQVQGDAAEADLKSRLEEEFVEDTVEDVERGIAGADLIQKIGGRISSPIASILWESKNTKQFSQEWISKLKDDQLKVKADLAILCTTAMPKNKSFFYQEKGIIIVDFRYFIPVASLIREDLKRIYKMKRSLEGGEKKMRHLYRYLLGPEFRSKMENIITAFSSLKSQIEQEKQAMNRIWSRREKEIDRVLISTSSMYGDLQGVTGESLPSIDLLELPDGKSS